jgi:adenylate cyclase
MSSALPNDGKAAALDAVHRLFESKALSEGERQRSLLRYLVSEEIEGRGAAIKAVSIAQDVFGRGAEFDPQADSIVRVEVGRLRKALALYYATDGQGDPVEISIATGGYRPSLTPRNPESTRRRWPDRKRLVAALVGIALISAGLAFFWLRNPLSSSSTLVIGVFKPEIGTLDKSRDFLKAGIRSEFIAELSRSSEFSVIPIDKEPDPAKAPRMDYLVRSTIQVTADRAVIQLTLQDGRTKRLLLNERREVAL